MLLTGAFVAGLLLSNLVNAAPLFEQEDVFISGHDGYFAYRIPATVGVLWERGTNSDYQFITFTRFNREWLEEKPVQKPKGKSATGADRRMKVLSKEVSLRYDGRRPPVTGFITYVSKAQPVLMHCHAALCRQPLS